MQSLRKWTLEFILDRKIDVVLFFLDMLVAKLISDLLNPILLVTNGNVFRNMANNFLHHSLLSKIYHCGIISFKNIPICYLSPISFTMSTFWTTSAGRNLAAVRRQRSDLGHCNDGAWEPGGSVERYERSAWRWFNWLSFVMAWF